MALLLLAQAALPGLVHAVTVDHGLRPDSATEAAFVAELCANLGVPHETMKARVADGNVQSEARHARYRAIGEWSDNIEFPLEDGEVMGLEAIMTAHHLDDQAETMVMRLNRGSGLSGLSGVRSRTMITGCGATIIRPLLGWRKSELDALVQTIGIAPVLDPSNQDDAFDRARIRKVMAEADWLDPKGLARSAQHLQEAESALEQVVSKEVHDASSREPDRTTYRPFASGMTGRNYIWKRVVQRLCRRIGVRQPSMADASAIVESLLHGQKINIAGIAAEAIQGDDGMPLWVLSPEAPRRSS